MARPLRIDVEGGRGQFTSRGIEQRSVFRDDRDREHFLDGQDAPVQASDGAHPHIVEVNDGLVVCRAWIPDQVPVLRGVIIGSMGMNWDYRHFIQRPAWQAAARIWGFALIGTGNDKASACKQGSAAVAADIRRTLDELARKSGRPELQHAAVCSFGFSAGSFFSCHIARGMPERTIAVALGGSKPDCWKMEDPNLAARVREVPILLTQGDRDDICGVEVFAALRTLRAQGLRVALAGQWGLSHYEGNYENLALIHFDRAIRRRLEPDWDPRSGPPVLRSIAEAAGWTGDLQGCEKWGTLQVEVMPAANVDEAGRRTQCWFVDETMARTWGAYALRHNAVMLVKPFCDSTDYIASREMPPPHPAGKPVTLAAASYWFKNVRKIEFHAGAECVASCSAGTDNATGVPWEAVWNDPPVGIHALYAVFIDEEGKRCVTKPCPLVVAATAVP